MRAENKTGFKGVSRQGGHLTFKAQLTRRGRNKYLGTFATAEEAALAVARELRKR